MAKNLETTEVQRALTSPFLSEETDFGKSFISDNRFRPDHFKGFNSSQIAQIFEENEKVVIDKNKSLDDEKEQNKAWEMYQSDVLKRLEEHEIRRQEMVKNENFLRAETLKLQQKELKKRKEKLQSESFGKIEEHFFQAFGNSCR